jgi:hypothetical protein
MWKGNIKMFIGEIGSAGAAEFNQLRMGSSGKLM